MKLRVNSAHLAELDRDLAGSPWPNGAVLEFVHRHRHAPEASVVAAFRLFPINPEYALFLAASAGTPEARSLVSSILGKYDPACDPSRYLALLQSGGDSSPWTM